MNDDDGYGTIRSLWSPDMEPDGASRDEFSDGARRAECGQKESVCYLCTQALKVCGLYFKSILRVRLFWVWLEAKKEKQTKRSEAMQV